MQHEIWHGESPQILRQEDNESYQPSQSSENPTGAPLQYPRVIADLSKRKKDQNQATLMQVHSPQTAQILEA